jgi:TrmH family RNA methyltransferase
MIRSLDRKKYRYHHRLFVTEGDKIVYEVLESPLKTECVLAKPSWLAKIPGELLSGAGEIIEINDKELSQISFLKTPNQAMALVRIPENTFDLRDITGGLSFYLDRVQDPGNLGTIIRIADWFGIGHVLCSGGCADPFNPKTIQATMGAITRVKLYDAGESFFEQLHRFYPGFPVYGTFLDGKNLYSEEPAHKAIIVMGNESKGISGDIARHVTERLLIPSYPPGAPTSESLNVAVAAAIVCAEFRRKS